VTTTNADRSDASAAEARELVAALERHYNEGDEAAILGLFADDVVVVTSAGQIVRGKGELAPWLTERLAGLGDFRTTKRYRAYEDGYLCIEYQTEVAAGEAPRLFRGAEVFRVVSPGLITEYRQYGFEATGLDDPVGFDR
jgi:hypothetical protein